MTATRADLFTRLASVQNHATNIHVDIMTITDFMDDVEMLRHVERYEKYCHESPSPI